MVLGGEETAGQQDLRSQSEPASETAYSQEEDTSQTPLPALSAVTRLVSKIENTRKPGEFQTFILRPLFGMYYCHLCNIGWSFLT